MSELTELYLKEKPVMALIKIHQAENETFCREISNDIDSTYAHTVKIISKFRKLGVLNTREKGRKKMLSLTESGEAQAELLIELINVCQESTVAGGGKIEDKQLFEENE